MESTHSVSVKVLIKQHTPTDDKVVTTGFMESGIDYDNWDLEGIVHAEALAVEFLQKLVQLGKEFSEDKKKPKPKP